MIPLIIVNWKMNFTLLQAHDFCNKLFQSYHSSLLESIIIAPSTPYLAYLSNTFSTLKFCSQNVSNIYGVGAYTGEYSSKILKSCLINYAMVGHYERRSIFGESIDVVMQKIKNCYHVSITPIFCIGESLELRQNKGYKDFLLSELEYLTKIPNLLGEEKLIIAYEPIWSIGSGLTPSYSELEEIFQMLNEFRHKRLVANNVRLVYGGSINTINICNILALPHIEGILIGKGGVDYRMFVNMLNLIR